MFTFWRGTFIERGEIFSGGIGSKEFFLLVIKDTKKKRRKRRKVLEYNENACAGWLRRTKRHTDTSPFFVIIH